MIDFKLAASSLIVCVSISGTAFAQATSPDPATTPAPTPTPTPAPATGVPVAEPTEPEMQPASGVNAPRTFEPGVMPQAQEERRDVVERSWPNRPMLITGGVLFGGTYAASVIVGAASDREADEKLYLPVVGPWLDLRERDCDVNECNNETLNKALLITDGALQGVGVLAIVLSLVIPETTETPWYLIGNSELFVAPQVGSATTGLTAVGRF